jgi:predicted DNA-binding transcriptional regulator AlpA
VRLNCPVLSKGVQTVLIPVSDVLSLVPVARSTLYLLMQRSDFPKPLRVGGRVFWEDKEINAWVQAQKDLRSQEA